MNDFDQSTLATVFMDELKRQGQELRDHSEKAEKASKQINDNISAVREQQVGFKGEIGTIHRELGEIKAKLEPLTTQVAINANNIDQLEKDKNAIFGHITTVKDAIRQGGPMPKTPEQTPIITRPSFWEGENAKYVFYLAIAVLAVVGLATGAMTTDDIKSIKP